MIAKREVTDAGLTLHYTIPAHKIKKDYPITGLSGGTPPISPEQVILRSARMLSSGRDIVREMREKFLSRSFDVKSVIINAVFFDCLSQTKNINKAIEWTIENFDKANDKSNSLVWVQPNISYLNDVLRKYSINSSVISWLIDGNPIVIDGLDVVNARYALLFIESIVRLTNSDLSLNIYSHSPTFDDERCLYAYQQLYTHPVFRELTPTCPVADSMMNSVYTKADILAELQWASSDQPMPSLWAPMINVISPLFLPISSRVEELRVLKGKVFHPVIFIERDSQQTLNSRPLTLPDLFTSNIDLSLVNKSLLPMFLTTMVTSLEKGFNYNICLSLRLFKYDISYINVPPTFCLISQLLYHAIRCSKSTELKEKRISFSFIRLLREIHSCDAICKLILKRRITWKYATTPDLSRNPLLNQKTLTVNDISYIYSLLMEDINKYSYAYLDNMLFNHEYSNDMMRVVKKALPMDPAGSHGRRLPLVSSHKISIGKINDSKNFTQQIKDLLKKSI